MNSPASTPIPLIRAVLSAVTLLAVSAGAVGSLLAAVPAASPQLFVSWRGSPDFTLEVGEPAFLGLRIETPEGGTAEVQLAPSTGTWADAVELVLRREGGTTADVRAVPAFQPDAPAITLSEDEAAEGSWIVPSAATATLAPGDYIADAQLVIRSGSGWTGTARSAPFPIRVVVVSSAPERAVPRAVAFATEALLGGLPEKAAGLIDPLLERSPDDFDLLRLRGAICLRGGNVLAAKRCVDRALETAAQENEHHPSLELMNLEARLATARVAPLAPGEDYPAWSRPPEIVLERTSSASRAPAALAVSHTPPTESASGVAPVAVRPAPAAPASTSTPPSAAPPVFVPSLGSGPAVAAPAAAAAVPAGVAPASDFTDERIRADAAGQWAESARAGSEYGPIERSASRAAGAPDVPGVDDHPNAWCPAVRNQGTDWLELTFARPVHASEVRVRQNFGPGAITKVEALDASGQGHTWWQGVDPYGQDGSARDPVWFVVRVAPTSYQVSKIKLTLNLGAHTRWKQIDAVQLVEAPFVASGVATTVPPSTTQTAPSRPAVTPLVPPPPGSPVGGLVRKLVDSGATSGAGAQVRKEDLLRPEFRFRRSAEWLVLPALAQQFSRNEEERRAVLDLLVQGVAGIGRLLDAEGADNDIAAATALSLSQLWSTAREREVPDEGAETLHAQIVAALAGPEVAAMSDADKQRYWEYCLGVPVFVLGMREVATESAAQADIRIIAATVFEALLGVRPELVEIGADGLKARDVPALSSPTAPAPAPVHAPPPAAVETTRVSRGAGSVAAVAYAAPAGWSREDADWATIFRATLGDLDHLGRPDVNSERKHQASIFMLPPRAAPQGPAALFEPMWRQEFGAFELGDAVVHYRSRLRSGLVVYFMGRFFNRPNQDNRENQTYAVLYLVDLGDRVQPITATLVPGKSMYSMTSMNESEGLRALSGPLGAFLDSIEPTGGAAAPYPAGGLFAPSEIRGNWVVSRSAFGGMYVYTATGLGAGAAVAGSSNSIDLRDDGTFLYKFAGYFQNPVVGGGTGQLSSDNNDGRYSLEGDVVRFTPRLARSYRYDRCAVGVGTVRTPDGIRRILAMVGANTSGVFRGPSLIPVGGSYDGLMDWFVEEPRGR